MLDQVYNALQKMPDYQLLSILEGRTAMTPEMVLQNIDFKGARLNGDLDEEGWFRKACREGLDMPTLLSYTTELVSLRSDGTLPPSADRLRPTRILVYFNRCLPSPVTVYS